MARWWEVNLERLAEPVRKERRRTLLLLEAEERTFDELGGRMLFTRLLNAVSAGLDLEEELGRPVEDRPIGYDWPDDPTA